MRALNRKLLRDTWQLRVQGLAIVAVTATGVAMFAMYLSTFDSLERSRADYYDRGRFAHVFVRCIRAPEALVERLAGIPGVAAVESRVVRDVNLVLPEVDAPATGRLISIPEVDRPTLNDVVLRRGRYLDPDGRDEVLVHETFAEEHDLDPGDRIAAIVNGRRRELTIAGVALSPEYVYVLGPGDIIPDPKRFGVLWMGRKALASAFDMDGAFNDLALRLTPGTASRSEAPHAILAAVNRLLEPHGGFGAVGRRHQPSHWFIENELRELRTMASILPTIFLVVAAFLLNIVLTRTITAQRTQIAALRALGYTNREVALHYLGFGSLAAILGAAAGTIVGARLGRGYTSLYANYFHFPDDTYLLAPAIALAATGVSLLAALAGCLGAVRRVSRLPPAEAMRPAPPPRFEPSRLERLGLRGALGPSGRMVLRNLARRPWRFLLSSTGVGLAIALMVLGAFFIDAIDHLITLQFGVVQRQDLTVTFSEPRASRARYELARMPGVTTVEPFRAVPVRLRFEHRSRQTTLLGMPAEPRLGRVVDRREGPLRLPSGGLLLSAALAEQLGARRGDPVRVEVLEGTRSKQDVELAGVVDDWIGLSAYMEAGALAHLLREDRSLSGAFLAVDPAHEAALFRTLQETPGVAGVSRTSAAARSFRETVRANMMRIILFNVLFSSIIAIGVVYNAARISLSERSRDLASLRVLGFTRTEISLILIGELVAITLMAIPIGVVAGTGLAALMLGLLRNELYRIPFVIEPSTFGWAVATVLVASIASAFMVRRRLDRLDLIGVLKTQE